MSPDKSYIITDEADVNENKFLKIMPAGVCEKLVFFIHRSVDVSYDKMVASLCIKNWTKFEEKIKKRIYETKLE